MSHNQKNDDSYSESEERLNAKNVLKEKSKATAKERNLDEGSGQ